MASELIDTVRGIRGTSFTLTDGSEHGFITSEESRKIIEALQMKADLEALTAGKDDCSIVVEKN